MLGCGGSGRWQHAALRGLLQRRQQRLSTNQGAVECLDGKAGLGWAWPGLLSRTGRLPVGPQLRLAACSSAGFPSVGKSTLLNKMTGTFSEVSWPRRESCSPQG